MSIAKVHEAFYADFLDRSDPEGDVRSLNSALERRTAQLEVALANLQAQNSQRTQAEAALRESEQRYRRLVELSPESILVIVDDRLAYINAAGVRLLHGADVHDLVGKTIDELVHPGDHARVTEGIREMSAIGSELQQAEVRIIRPDGTLLEAEITAAAVTFDGRPAIQALVRDVGERRAMERMKDELLSIVSHELRTPLTSLRGSLGLLAGGLLGELPSRGQRMLDIAVSNADRLIRLLNDVLDLERMRSGRLTLELTDCDAMDLVEQALAEMRGLAVRSKVMLSVGRVDGIVVANPDRIVQVLTNLLSNAIKFSDPYGMVRLAAETHGNRVRFSVADQGRGIPPDKLETIFERFQQVDASDSRDKGGTGLGLAICRSIVQQHGGRVWAESTLGQGSTFYVELRSATIAIAA